MVGISGRRSKQRIYDSARQGGKEFSCPKTRTGGGGPADFPNSAAFCGRARDTGSVTLLRVVLMYVLGNSEYAGFAFELDFAGRVRRELDLSGFCAKPRHHIPDRCALIQTGEHESPIGGIFPDPQLLHGAPQDLVAGIAISVLEGGIDIDKPPFLQRCDGKSKRARRKYPFKFFLERLTAVFGPCQSGFRAFELGNPRFKRLTVDACGFVQPRILNRGRCGNSKQFGTAKMFLRIKIGFGMADRKAPKIFSRCDERRGEPGAQLLVPFEGVPFFLMFVSAIKTLFCSVKMRWKNVDSSATKVRGARGPGFFGWSGQVLSPRASICGPPSGTSTRAHVYGTNSSSDLSRVSMMKSIRRSWVSESVALRNASASSSVCFCAVISSAVPTSRRILPSASRTGKPRAHTQRSSPWAETIRNFWLKCPVWVASSSFESTWTRSSA